MLIARPNFPTDRTIDCRSVNLARDRASFSTISQAYRTEVEAYCATVSILKLAEPSNELAGAPRPSRATVEAPPRRRIGAGYTRPEVVRELMPRRLQSSAAAAPSPAPPTFRAFAATDDLPPAHLPPSADLAPLATAAEFDMITALPDDRLAPAPVDRRRSLWSRPTLATSIAILVVLSLAMVGWRNRVVEMAPRTASLYSAIGLPVYLRGFRKELRTMKEIHDGVPLLGCRDHRESFVGCGKGSEAASSLRDWTTLELYSWTTILARTELAPRETLTFSSRLSSPPPQTNNVIVRFLKPGEIIDAPPTMSGG